MELTDSTLKHAADFHYDSVPCNPFVLVSKIEMAGSSLNRPLTILFTKPKHSMGLLATLRGFIRFARYRLFPRMFMSSAPTIMSAAEVLGRLVFRGHKILEHSFGADGSCYVSLEVSSAPKSIPKDLERRELAPIFGMTRFGRYNEKISVYKLRTMHPFSQYLQQYLISSNGFSDSIKIASDFRLTSWGLFLRRYWLDEIPMIWNWCRGDIKLVGVRPVSQVMLETFPPKLKQLRFNMKPGLIPAALGKRPKNIDDVINYEICYLQDYLKRGAAADIEALREVFITIFLARERSE